MRYGLGAILFTMLLLATAAGQSQRSRIYSTPVPPNREVLDRLNLRLAWSSHVPMDGMRDGLLAIRLTGKTLLVQTRSGLVSQIDAETGKTLWRTRVGDPYRTEQPLTFNATTVFVLNSNFLYGIDRSDGTVQYQMPLSGGISAPPIADDEQLYLPTTVGRLRTFRLPNLIAEKLFLQEQAELAEKAALGKETPSTLALVSPASSLNIPLPGTVKRVGPQPVEAWSSAFDLRLDYQPLVGSDTIALPSDDGTLSGFPKNTPPLGGAGVPLYTFRAGGTLVVPPGQYEDVCYYGSSDSNLYAILIPTGQVLWRHTAGTSISRQPLATASDVYVSSERNGLARLDRTTGEALWRVPRGNRVLSAQPDVDRVLAVNPKFVYATDRSGRIVILDRIRGTILSTWDLRDFVFVTPNDWTDRLYLAAHNGLIVCLHDRQYVAPFFHKEIENSLLRKLTKPYTITQIFKRPLKEALRIVEIDLQVKMLISKPAFRDAGLEPIEDKEVLLDKIGPEQGAPTLRDALQKLLDPFGATFEPIEDTLLIVPKPKGADKPAEKPADMNPAEKKDMGM